MSRIIETANNDIEIETMTSSKSRPSEQALRNKREVKRRLDDYFEQKQLKQLMGDDF
ncbi:PA3496 family putative envelope integrity protein [Shewanella marina]|uniref:PA3496 family putative envelope integrity protein n=1 Tax=Shewanella marina TaxID=487319 RepID=UPI000ADF5D22|nr:hypothetical protein [Shewanella marina]